jgi:hypothetical protein
MGKRLGALMQVGFSNSRVVVSVGMTLSQSGEYAPAG